MKNRKRLTGMLLAAPVLLGTFVFLLLPLVLPIASAVMVIQVFFAETGIINHWLISIGVPMVQWMEGPSAFYVLLGLYIWKSFGYSVILLLSGLNTIPEEFYQTAAVEGAGSLKKLVSITLPMMAPHFFLAAVMGIVNAFKSYREAFLLGGKHPHDSIYMIQRLLLLLLSKSFIICFTQIRYICICQSNIPFCKRNFAKM